MDKIIGSPKQNELSSFYFNMDYDMLTYNEKEFIDMKSVNGKKCINCDNDATHSKNIMTIDGIQTDAPVCDLCGDYYDDFKRLP